MLGFFSSILSFKLGVTSETWETFQYAQLRLGNLSPIPRLRLIGSFKGWKTSHSTYIFLLGTSLQFFPANQIGDTFKYRRLLIALNFALRPLANPEKKRPLDLFAVVFDFWVRTVLGQSLS